VGAPLFYIDSRGRLSLGINQRNFSETYKISPGTELVIAARH
jgi:S-adenosylmethionine hydrolase